MRVESVTLKSIYLNEVWPLIKQVAEKELYFPQAAIASYGKMFERNELKARLTNSKTPMIAAYENKKLMGVLVGGNCEGGVGTIIWMVVAPSFRGRGVGEALFSRGCELYLSLGCHKIKLTASTHAAVRFYETMGMRVEGMHSRHWWDMDFWALGKIIS